MTDCMVRGCEEEATMLSEPGIYICETHVGPRDWVCKFCGISIKSQQNASARKTGGKHKDHCPRAETNTKQTNDESRN